MTEEIEVLGVYRNDVEDSEDWPFCVRFQRTTGEELGWWMKAKDEMEAYQRAVSGVWNRDYRGQPEAEPGYGAVGWPWTGHNDDCFNLTRNSEGEVI